MNSNPNWRYSTDKDYCASDFQHRCHSIFVIQERYSYIELAGYLGVRPDTALRWFECKNRMHVDYILGTIAFVAEKNPRDTELIDCFAKAAGRITIRESEIGKTLNDSHKDDLLDLHRFASGVSETVRKAYSDGRLTRQEHAAIQKTVREAQETLAEVLHRAGADVENGTVGEEGVKFLRRRVA